MRMLYLTAGVLCVGVAACGYDREEAAYNNEAPAYPEGAEGTDYAANGTAGGTAAATTWPEGARIVIEEGVTYRIMPGGERVTLGPNESRIVVEDGVRYRVDPDGARIRIDDEGLAVDVDAGDVEATVNTR